MQIVDFAREYQAKTDEDLLRLAIHSEELTAEAKTYLTSELSKRGIGAEQVRAFRESELRPGPALAETQSIAPIPNTSEASYTLGPPLAAETLKAPWKPKVAGRIAFFFGPVAGALVASTSLRRMGYAQGARRVFQLALGIAVVEGVIFFFVPDTWTRLIGIGAEIAFLLTFPALMEKEFIEWQATHPNTKPSNGWNAIGWGFLGILGFFAVGIIVIVLLSLLFPNIS